MAEWRSRLGERAAASETVPAELLTRMMSLLVELLAESAGPLRREVREIWARASEHYGRAAAARGLAAGEVVDEFAALRDALTRDLAATVAAMRARRGLAVLLHLNRVVDRGAALAVAGYTDALVATLFLEDGVPRADSALDGTELERRQTQLEGDLRALTAGERR